MFKGTYQQGLVTVLFSGGPRPLAIWGSCARSGQVRRVMDDDTRSLVLELSGTNVATTYIHAPPCARGSLALRLPFFVMHVKNLNRYFTLEIQVLDDKNMRRRIAFSNFTSCSQVHTFCCHAPFCLDSGWNVVNINLADFVRRIYGTSYIETQRIQVHANCRIRRIYFSDRIYSAEELPADYKLYDPNQTKPSLKRKKSTPATEPVGKTEFIDLVALPFDTQQIQITLPDYTSLGVSVPPPSEAETPRTGITEPALDETDAKTTAPGEPRAEPSEPDGLVAPPESTEEPTTPPESTEEPIAPPESTEEPVAPPETTEEPTAPPESTEEPAAPPEPTEEPAAPPESTEEPAAPLESTEEPAAPPESTEEPAAPPESTEQPVAQRETAEEPVAPSEPTEEPITEATSPDEHNEETPAPD